MWKNKIYLNESKQQAPTVFKHMSLCSEATLNIGNDKVILQDFLSVLHDFPMLQQWFNVFSKLSKMYTP
jgi:hypothetical protein